MLRLEQLGHATSGTIGAGLIASGSQKRIIVKPAPTELFPEKLTPLPIGNLFRIFAILTDILPVSR